MKIKIIFIIISFQLFYITAIAEDLGKISALKLDSLSVDRALGLNHLSLRVKAKKTGNLEPAIAVNNAVKKSLEYFFLGLAMAESVFWVNLSPDEPERIIDNILGNTDLGRIMLHADFKLKEDVGVLTNPKTSKLGREFWNRLYAKAERLGINEIPLINRLWIVPDKAVIYERDGQVSIVKSRLKVCLESAYLSENREIKDKRQKELQDFASNLMEELILPHLNQMVNEAYSYADLREIYNALIFARWYKEKYGYKDNFLLTTVNLGVLDDVELNFTHSPQEIYSDYLKSVNEGEYSFSEERTELDLFGETFTTTHYFSGGVDFTDIRIVEVDNQDSKESDTDSIYYVYDLFFPASIKRPLQYAKDQIQLIPKDKLQHQDASLALAKNLPAIAPVNFAKQNLQDLDYTEKTERLVLSKL